MSVIKQLQAFFVKHKTAAFRQKGEQLFLRPHDKRLASDKALFGLWALFTSGLFATGCASSLAAAHGPTVIEPGHWEVEAHATETLPLNLLAYAGQGASDARRIAQDLKNKGQTSISAQDSLAEITAISVLLAEPPHPDAELTVRCGLPFPMDLGVRLSPQEVRGESYVRLFTGRWHAVVGVGYTHKWYLSGVLGAVALLPPGPLQREDVDASFLIGTEWDPFTFYGGVRATYSLFHGPALNTLTTPPLTAPDFDADVLAGRGAAFIPEGLVGVRVGSPHIQLEIELDFFRTFYRARLFGQSYDLGVYALVPNIGLVFPID
jgi:hypothetical protein